MDGVANEGSAVPDALARICADTLAEVERRRAATPEAALRARLADASAPRGFAAALARSVAAGRFGLIAEIKKASPSAGLIRAAFDPAELAATYVDAGATCLSVLTDGPYFQGSDGDLGTARAARAVPVLRKDFMLDAWQIVESRTLGADCVLLILAALSDARAAELEGVALELGMDVLAEVHDAAELERALRLRTTLIGVNNRNLKTLRTDLATTEGLARLVPADRVLVAESGIRSHADVRRLAGVGARCFLVGESLLKQADVGRATRALLGA